MNLAEKLEIAQALRDLGVDVIEAGFPIASPGDFEAVQAIAQHVHGPIICGLARCNDDDIDRAWEALQRRARPRIHVFLATSAIHREFKLHMAKEEIVRRAVEGVKRAKRATARTWSSRPRMPPAPSSISWPRWSRRPSRPAPPRSTFRTRSATPSPAQYAAAIRHLKQHVPQHRQGRHQRPLPQRPGPGRRQQPGRREGRRPAGRMHHQRHRRAGRQLCPRRNRHGPRAPGPTTST